MNEKQLIELIIQDLPHSDNVILGPGDDCAITQIPSHLKNPQSILKVDSIVEDIHFTSDELPEKVGRKALARPVSDFAAMGCHPSSALISLSLPTPLDTKWVSQFYQGMVELAKELNISIVGGETTGSPKGKMISVSVSGFCEEGGFISRNGAQKGDAIFVTGTLGGSLDERHLLFQPRLKEGEWLRQNFKIHSMMDLSDGLASDLSQILGFSSLGADLLKPAIPIAKAAKTRHREGRSKKFPLEAAMTDGEDYELVFTVAPKDAVPLKDGFKKTFPETPISCIGKVSPKEGIRFQTEQGFELLRQKGFDHFENPDSN